MTEVAKTNVITEPSLITAKRLTAHKIVVKDTGEVIRMTNDHRMVYSHLEDQFRGLTDPKNIAAGKSTGHYYDSDENLAIRCDVSEYIFKKVKKDLKALGLIDWIPPKARKSGHSCEYFVKPVDEVAHNLEFIFQELPNGKPSYDHERVSGQKTKKSKQQGLKTEDKQENGKSEQAKPQAEQGKPTGQSADVAPESSPASVEQRDSVESDNGSDDRADDNHVPKAASQETTGRVMASLDDLRCWSEVGSGEGMDDYGVIWGVEGIALYNLIDEHLEIRKSETENFKSQRAH